MSQTHGCRNISLSHRKDISHHRQLLSVDVWTIILVQLNEMKLNKRTIIFLKIMGKGHNLEQSILSID